MPEVVEVHQGGWRVVGGGHGALLWESCSGINRETSMYIIDVHHNRWHINYTRTSVLMAAKLIELMLQGWPSQPNRKKNILLSIWSDVFRFWLKCNFSHFRFVKWENFATLQYKCMFSDQNEWPTNSLRSAVLEIWRWPDFFRFWLKCNLRSKWVVNQHQPTSSFRDIEMQISRK